MLNQFSRTELIIGKENIEKLNNATVAIFGIGGVGSYVIEGLARAGIGNFILIDNDVVTLTNINRQIIATHKTLNQPKVEVAKQRILDINPNANVKIYKEFFKSGTEGILNNKIIYIVDAIDTISSKVELIVKANELNIPIISCMGTGNKLNPTDLKVADIFDTKVCPLAKIMRKELRNHNIAKLKVIYSTEEPIKKNNMQNISEENAIGSISFVPSVAGLIIAGEVIKDLIKL